MKDTYRKSSFSDQAGTDCVEVRIDRNASAGAAKEIAVRHSKRHRTVIKFSTSEWTAFVRGVKSGEFDI
ncbi:DUF397 domain-containing protein [Candidatus Kaiserbacteria bacterium]|nr:DUF397 domain-containing protein [Candidatus Kaiserbacteria bacterium]